MKTGRTICFPFVGNDVGGSHISALGLIRALDPSRFDPLVLVQDRQGSIAAMFDEEGIATEVAPPSPSFSHGSRLGPADLLALARAAKDLARFLRRRGVAIVHTNDGRTHASWALPAKLAGARLVWHHRGSPDALGKRLLAPLLADQLISVSDFAARSRGFALPVRRSAIVHSPFDTSLAEDRTDAKQALLHELGCAPSTNLVGFSGAMTARKRPLLFVEAIAKLLGRAPGLPVRGVMFGDYFDVTAAMIRKRARSLGVEHAIHLMGFRSPGSRWLAGCDMLMVPAVDEPFGRTLIEAMLVGTPVVATRSGGNVEALRGGELGLLVEPENPDMLAQAAIRALSDPEIRDATTARAQADARTRFGIARHAEAVMNLYDELLLKRSARAPALQSREAPVASRARSAAE